MTAINLDPTVRKEFEKLLPKDMTLADAIREYMKSVVDENDKKNGLAPNVTCISELPTVCNINNRQQTILSFLCNKPKPEISKEINETDEIKTLTIYRDYGRCMMTVSQTKIMKVMKK